jgi:esterase/lipase superfamily enzyme
MELLWFGHAGRPVLVFPTSVGRFYQNEDFGLVGGLKDKIDAGYIQLCCVDGVDNESWYNKSAHPAQRVQRHDQYDRYLAQELAPFIFNRAGRGDLVVYGASFGGYHAANFALRHPELVTLSVAFSGLYDIHRFLDGYWDDLCYFHCPTAYSANFPPELVERLNRMGIATGEHDHLMPANRDFGALLQQRGVGAHVEIWPGVFGHDWSFWIDNLRRFV